MSTTFSSFSQMKIVAYRTNAFLVSGPETQKYAEQLTQHGGFYNMFLENGPAWIFSETRRSEIKRLLLEIQTIETLGSRMGTTELPTSQTTTMTIAAPFATNRTSAVGRASLPTISPQNMQTVSWILIRPQVNMTASLIMDGQRYPYYVEEARTDPSGSIVDTLVLRMRNSPDSYSLAVIVNGQWQVWGLTTTHSLEFS